ncbi:hypothetical protein [Cryptosporangium sp. NPDC048952]|uniref:hypothetical protein n=1 Tax=Cryptosporangium sp. NPDC048952 TaxID=3363961 RepID=UPI00371782B3
MSATPPTSSPRAAVRQVAIALIVVAALDLILGFVACCGRVARLGQSNSTDLSSDAEAAGYLTYTLLAVVSLPVGALILAAGIMLLRGRGRTLGQAGAIAAMVPVTCCFLAGIPVGIWTLIVLKREDVKAVLDGRGGPPPGPGGYPPPPGGYPPPPGGYPPPPGY